MDIKGLMQRALFHKWKRPSRVEEGFCIIIPIPEDMPFLARLALEGLKGIETEHCGQILVVGDGKSEDMGSLLAKSVSQFHDSRIEIVLFSSFHRWLVHRVDSPHWLTVIYGTNASRYAYAFLHDADAFFLNRSCIEDTYRYCVEGSYYTTGVDARWDPFFTDIGYQIPGTWQMMFDVNWLRQHKPWMVRGRTMDTPHGTNTFDTMLYPQYLDYSSGKIGVMADPPKYVHFNGTIVTYRAWKRANGRQVVDELFRLLLLSILERVVPSDDGRRLLPSIEELAYGLTDSSRPIRYDTLDCARNYGEFRGQIKELCESPVFAGERAEKIQSLLAPFDAHFAKVRSEIGDQLSGPVKKFRRNGLAQQ
jgi:hypothetical protein